MVVNPVNVVNPPATEVGPEGPQGPPGVPGPTIYPPAGLAVSTGTAWGTSIPTADVVLLNAANTFTADQSIEGNLSVAGNAHLNGDAFIFGSTSGQSSIFSDGFSLSLATNPAGALYLNQGSGAVVVFGDGAGNEVGRVDSSGNAHFNGTVTSGALNVTEMLSTLQARLAALEAKVG